MPSPIFLLERIISTRTHFNCFAASLKMSKQSRITFSLNLNVNLFLTRVFSIYIQFCSSSLPAICALRPLPTWEFAKLLLLPSSEEYCSQCCSACSVSPAEELLQWGESSDHWARVSGQMETYIVTPGGEYYPRHHQYQEQTTLGDQEHHQEHHQDPRSQESGDKQGEQTGQARQQVRYSQQMRTVLRESTFSFNV